MNTTLNMNTKLNIAQMENEWTILSKKHCQVQEELAKAKEHIVSLENQEKEIADILNKKRLEFSIKYFQSINQLH